MVLILLVTAAIDSRVRRQLLIRFVTSASDSFSH
jgi:hypothetical protein